MQVSEKVESRPRSLSGKKNAFYAENKGTIHQEARIVVNLHISILLCTKTSETKSVKNMRKKHNHNSRRHLKSLIGNFSLKSSSVLYCLLSFI